MSPPVEVSGPDAVTGSLVLLAAGLALPLLDHPLALPCPLRTLTGIPVFTAALVVCAAWVFELGRFGVLG